MKMKTNGNEMAFPDPILGSNVSSTEGLDTGLTKREYFAALAMQGMLHNWGMTKAGQQILAPDTIAMLAVNQADALIEALNKEDR